jgi:hypothetical protein
MASLIYNSVTLPYVDTVNFNEVARSDESNTDWYLTEFDIQVQSIISPAYLSVLAADVFGSFSNSSNPWKTADLLDILRARLLERRRPFSFIVNGVNAIPQPPVGNRGSVDIDNGPIPQSCNIIALPAGSFLIQYSIKASYWENNLKSSGVPHVTNINGNPILYNRWSESQTIDNCNYSTFSREGKFVIRSDNSDGQGPDFYRNKTSFLGIPDGCVRVSSYYKLDPNGLAMDYAITDKEVYRKPPDPASEARGWVQQDLSPFGAKRVITSYCWLKGSKTANQGRLMSRAIRHCMSKILSCTFTPVVIQEPAFPGDPGTTRTHIANLIPIRDVIKADTFENIVECTLSVLATITVPPGVAVNRLLGGLDLSVSDVHGGQGMCSPPRDDDPDYLPIIGQYGTYQLAQNIVGGVLQAAAYWDPSLNNFVSASQRKVVGTNVFVPGQLGKVADSRRTG